MEEREDVVEGKPVLVASVGPQTQSPTPVPVAGAGSSTETKMGRLTGYDENIRELESRVQCKEGILVKLKLIQLYKNKVYGRVALR